MNKIKCLEDKLNKLESRIKYLENNTEYEEDEYEEDENSISYKLKKLQELKEEQQNKENKRRENLRKRLYLEKIDILYRAVVEYSEIQQWLDENKITLRYLVEDER